MGKKIEAKDEQIILKLNNISKNYDAGGNVVQALKNVSIAFRKSEFVSILGASGSGKTTMLNIIGGLDKYSDGDLIIAGKSTKQYDDRDWDRYRNLRVGFIFQSYNLIPHQTVLSNVELALTISGVDKEERRVRAIEALEKVGLKEQIHKKPNQLSGGQCQRVAIARALVNSPEILLADEPTGALDSKTSVQIMDLIKEVAKDKLVIMVTHNPDLAKSYSTRIVNLADGEIANDTNPVDLNANNQIEDNINKISKAKMSFPTAVRLSFRNLISKRHRSILVSIASSIGIIGISAVLAISFGVNNYISGMQDDMLSSYPLRIAEESLDLSVLSEGLLTTNNREIEKFDVNTEVGMDSMINYLMDRFASLTNVKTNDINETLLTFISEMPNKDVSALQYEYGIDVTNNIFCNWTSSALESSTNQIMSLNGLTQRYISELKTVDGFSRYANYVSLFTNFMKEMPGDESYILGQYDLLGNSKFAKNADEIMLVVEKDTTLTDLTLGQMGYYCHDDFINIGKKSVEVQELKKKLDDGEITQEQYDVEMKKLDEKYPYKKKFNYSDLIGSEFYYFPHDSLYSYGEVSDEVTMNGYVILNRDDYNFFLLYTSVLNYDALAGYVIPHGQDPKEISFVRAHSTSTDENTFFDGNWTYLEGLTTPIATLTVDSANKHVDFAGKLASDQPAISLSFDNSIINCTKTGNHVGYNYGAKLDSSWISDISAHNGLKMKVTGILRAKEEVNFGALNRGVYYTKALTDKYMNDSLNSQIIVNNEHGMKQFFNSRQASTSAYRAYVTFPYVDYSKETTTGLELKDDGYASALNGDSSASLTSLFSGGGNIADYTSTNAGYFRALCGLKTIEPETTLGAFQFKKLPQRISIYPKDFEAKDNITNYLDRWNQDGDLTIGGVVVSKSERKQLSYTDTVELIINMINRLIMIVTVALIAFTSLSLVVSCFMIAVITYISVMERVKEIGVIRSLGGRKKDVSRLFIAENMMTGLASGVLGIVVTYILSGIINLIVIPFNIGAIAALPWWTALIMIAISILLSVISGYLPSRRAAKQNPVEALRSE